MKLNDGILSGRLGVNYDISLPERFTLVNNAIALDGYAISLSLAGENFEPMDIKISPAADGTFSAQLEGFKGQGGIYATSSAAKGESVYASNAEEVKVNASVPFAFAQTEYNAHFDEQFTPKLVFEGDSYSIL
ncbi:MAG: hypothetical protein K2L00_06080 [Muribaculaceae bacterium]|nr:hypothetical protein [Muribaculaceae bacterium]